ncbi:MAG: thioredoxin [Candidatus Marinimicrobia bacterium]|nr:thioredoxin [Candidatus Neomarinimicrobiota bacterium]MBL7023010.1 thioredoxin [Candidatus Neomarinimicrobiota bacterium]MBL7109650.1 thioredoxin [Candidatus Neomarinimicrobiota bacterium]
MGDFTKTLTDDNFEIEILNSDKPALVDFWAEWCGPCIALGPTVDSIAEEYDGKAVVGKVNVDHHPTIAAKYSIRSIPSLLIFSNGKVEEQLIGAVSKEEITSIIDRLL